MKSRKLNLIYAIILVITLLASFVLSGCGTESVPQDSSVPEDSNVSEDSNASEDSNVPENNNDSEDSKVSEDSVEASSENSYNESNISPEFKELVDSYETYMDRYFEFMKTYDENDKSQEDEFLEIIAEYTAIDRELKEWEKKGLNADEQLYYGAALDRVGEKQMEAGIAKG